MELRHINNLVESETNNSVFDSLIDKLTSYLKSQKNPDPETLAKMVKRAGIGDFHAFTVKYGNKLRNFMNDKMRDVVVEKLNELK